MDVEKLVMDVKPCEQDYEDIAGYDESGTFTLTGEDTATKTSSYTYRNELCSGTCTDTLTRMDF